MAFPENKSAVWQAFTVMPDMAPVHDVGRGQARILVDAAQTKGSWWLGTFVSEPGRKTALHVHYSAEEQFYVLEGVLSVWLRDHWLELPAGSVAAVPRGTPHAIGNRSQQPIRFLNSGNPAGFENFFIDIEGIVKRLPYGSPDFLAALKELYPKYDSKLLAPPPEG